MITLTICQVNFILYYLANSHTPHFLSFPTQSAQYHLLLIPQDIPHPCAAKIGKAEEEYPRAKPWVMQVWQGGNRCHPNGGKAVGGKMSIKALPA